MYTALIKSVAYPLQGLLYALISVLSLIYAVDIFRDIFVNGRFGLLLVGLFLFPLVMTVLYWAALAALLPLDIATSDDDDVKPAMRAVALLVVPAGFAVGFLLWQAQNWLLFGLLNVEPWLYNTVFRLVGLEV